MEHCCGPCGYCLAAGDPAHKDPTKLWRLRVKGVVWNLGGEAQAGGHEG